MTEELDPFSGTESLTWNDFLTERDRRHLASGWRKEHPFGLGSAPVLLVIDVVYASTGIEPEPILESVKTWPMSCGLDGWRAVGRLSGLLARARESGVPIIYTAMLAEAGLEAHDVTEVRTIGQDPSPTSAQMGNEIIREVAPMHDELVIRKAGPSSFAGTPLQQHLIRTGRDTVVCVGETTSGCVRASVVDAVTLGFRAAVVDGCCFDRTQMSHHASLFDMDQKYCDVISVEQAGAYFADMAAPRA